MTAPSDADTKPVPSAVLGFKIDSLATEILELRRELRGLVSRDLYEEGRRADQRRIEQTENALRDLIAATSARRDADERERSGRRWQLMVAVFAACASFVIAIVKMP